LRSEAAGDLLLDLARTKIPFGAVVCEGYMGHSGEQQHRPLIAFEPLPEIVGIGLGHPAAFAVVPWGDGRQLFLPPCQNIAITLLQVLVIVIAQALGRALGHSRAGLLEQAFTHWVRSLRGAEHALFSVWLRYTERLRNPASPYGPGCTIHVHP